MNRYLGAIKTITRTYVRLIDDMLVNKRNLYTATNHENIFFPLEYCTSINGFNFKGGWHFLVATLKQFEEHPLLKYEESFLAKYYQCYQPLNLEEALFGRRQSIKDDSLKRYRDPQNAPMPWTPLFMLPNKYKTNRADYGPKDKASSYGEERFNKLISLYKSIKTNGFLEKKEPLNDITGVILKRDSEYKLLVANGNHRTAVLSVLGYSKVLVRLHRTYPKIVDIDNIEKWPCVFKGIYNKDTASKIFMHYFESNGDSKAREWKIID